MEEQKKPLCSSVYFVLAKTLRIIISFATDKHKGLTTDPPCQ